MVGLAVINLGWIIFDALWSVRDLRALMGLVLPQPWLSDYAIVHENFFRIDLVFVAIFISEFLLRWAAALHSRRYPYWFAYPILHWYDIIGCIPIAGFRWLRILRVIAILRRLQHLGWIDYRTWTLYQIVLRGYDILMEEISDRVVLRVLGGVQTEIAASHAIERRLINEVLLPRQSLIIEALYRRFSVLAREAYADSRMELHGIVTQAVSTAVRQNREIRRIDRIPLVGGQVGDLLDHAITDIVCRVLDEFAAQLDSVRFRALFEDMGNTGFDAFADAAQGPGASDELSRAIIDMIEIIKQQVGQRRWLQAANPSTVGDDIPHGH